MINSTFVIVGDEFLTLQCAEILLERGHEIKAIVSSAPRSQDWAAQKNIATLSSLADLPKCFEKGAIDWLLSIANLQIIAAEALSLPRKGTINFHDGLLPHRAGLNTPSWSLIEGSAEHGVTWHVVAGGIDEGDILAQQSFPLAPDETALTLNAKCLEAGMASFVQVVDQIESGALQGKAQDLSQRQYYAKNQRPDALATLDFGRPAAELSSLVRALSFGDGYRNPLVTPKIAVQGRVFPVTALQVNQSRSGAAPGSVIAIADSGVVVATADFDVQLVAGPAADGSQLAQVVGAGDVLGLTAAERTALTAASLDAIVGEGRHKARIARAADIDLSLIADSDAAGRTQSVALNLPAGTAIETIAAFFARLTSQDNLSLAYANDGFAALNQQFSDYFSASVPLNLAAAPDMAVRDYIGTIARSLVKLRKDGPYLADLTAREPDLTAPRLTMGLKQSGTPGLLDGCAATITIGETGAVLQFDDRRLSATNARRLASWLQVFAGAVQESPDMALKRVPLLSPEELHDLLHARNETALDYDRKATVHWLIEAQVDRTPDAIAVARGSQALTYRQLDAAANKLAAQLIARGVGAGTLVGLHLQRSVEMVVSVLGIHKAGGAYVPLDPEFPADRISYMVEDSKALLVVTDRRHANGLGLDANKLILIEDVLAGPNAPRPGDRAAPSDLAYVIYTSGSTGRPKGVMVEHGNVVNFFAGMDQRIPVNPGGDNVWLAVTSLSFDISVLELCWTLTRGFKVVLHVHHAAAAKSERGALARPVEFGLYYWGNDEGVGPAKYQLLLDGAKIADANGFTSLWTPERHFGAFGGPYPNPSVTGAAVAAVTKNLSIRAGSCVLPLHHPARVAEEWAVIDNISNGRVAMAFASGWMPEDFVLRPENAPPNNKTAMLRDIDMVRRLWRGEKVKFSAGGMDVDVVTQPRPIQKELPIWVTSAGNPETFRDAARQGANLLTHLLGQSVDELAEKIAIYRATLAELGHDPSQFKVTLMLHTLLGEDREKVREQARQPMKDYLRSATALIKQYAWAFPAFKKPAGATQAMDVDLRTLNEEELDGILEYAFLRYFEESGLFGTVEDGWERVRQVAAIGVDEVACLIDYGVPTQEVLAALQPLSALVTEVRSAEIAEDEEGGLALEVSQHQVTHLQCTPSMAMMFLSAEEDKAALAQVKHLFIGGEALNASLVRQLNEASPASIENMYGPTETTIWSSTMSVPGNLDGVVPIGTPIANTQLYVLDAHQQPVPMGIPGELFIGGDGVTRGYYNRPDLTETRFFADPAMGGRMYKTGDLVSVDPQSRQIKFIGRTDFQVKVRGYRIELGEIETAIGAFAGIKENVVLARKDDDSDIRLVAYLRLTGVEFDEAGLRAHLSSTLAPYMVPSQFVVMQNFPLTPNAKVDRNKLPAPKAQAAAAQAVANDSVETPPENDAQRTVAEVFKRTLGLQQVGLYDNFFTLGGHSLLAVHMHRELKGSVAPDLAITDIFRYPTVAALAQRISQAGVPDIRLSGAAQRAAERRNAMANRFRPHGG
nr:MupA/Atu3671 family FMN-dependent luciferase-like monooxygenase [uncultured Devosia sp.]